MTNARPHGGVASFHAATPGGGPLAGECAGLQDALWGFGIRLAIESGVLAARCLLDGSSYQEAWRRELQPALHASLVNRALYERCGNRGYVWLLRAQQSCGDTRRFLRWLYRAGPIRRRLLPWATGPARAGASPCMSPQ
jgi:flavin-dependent dehydrogenase